MPETTHPQTFEPAVEVYQNLLLLNNVRNSLVDSVSVKEGEATKILLKRKGDKSGLIFCFKQGMLYAIENGRETPVQKGSEIADLLQSALGIIANVETRRRLSSAMGLRPTKS